MCYPELRAKMPMTPLNYKKGDPKAGKHLTLSTLMFMTLYHLRCEVSVRELRGLCGFDASGICARLNEVEDIVLDKLFPRMYHGSPISCMAMLCAVCLSVVCVSGVIAT
jgi:hypothetical protein